MALPATTLQNPHSAAAAASSASASPAGASPASSEAPPKSVRLEALAAHEPNMKVYGPKATGAEIDAAVAKNDFFGLRRLLNNTVATEWASKSFDYQLRCKFFDAGSKLQGHFRSEIEKIQTCKGEYARFLNSQDLGVLSEQRDLLSFASGGQGLESGRIFGRVVVDSVVQPYDDKYPGRMMALPHDAILVRVGDKIPGTDTVLAAGVLGLDSDGKPQEKYRCKVEGGLVLQERVELRANIFKQAMARLSTLSELLTPRIGQLGYPAELNHGVVIFLRGEQCSGKSKLLYKFFGMSPDDIFDTNSIRGQLGGDLAHHEAASISDKISDETKRLLLNTISVKTHTKDRDLNTLTKTAPNTTHVIVDIAIEEATAERRVAERARPILSNEIKKGHKESVANRLVVIQKACENPSINYRLYNYDGEEPILVTEIVKKKVIVHQEEMLMKALGGNQDAFAKLTLQ